MGLAAWQIKIYFAQHKAATALIANNYDFYKITDYEIQQTVEEIVLDNEFDTEEVEGLSGKRKIYSEQG